MSLLKFLSREKLVEYLDEELRVFLNDREIYEITQYGWLADNRPDPDYLGLAMWQTDPPSEAPEISAIPDFSESSVKQAGIAEMLDKGRTFEELMKSARHSIGLGYLYFNNPDSTNPCFGFHFSETKMKLTMAANQLLAFFVEAFSDLADLKAKNGNHTPHFFDKHVANKILVKVKNILTGNPSKNQEMADSITELMAFVETFHNFQDSDSSPDIELLIDWYQLTIKIADKIFLTEYLFRNYSQPPQMGRIVEHQ